MTTAQEKEKPSTPKLELKLLVDDHSNRVLFAEAGKEVVDFLVGLLRLPLGLVARLLVGEQIPESQIPDTQIPGSQIPGSLNSIYTSIKNLNEIYLVSPDRDVLLNPRLPTVSLPLLESEPPPPVILPPKKYYRCKGIYGQCRGMPTNFVTDTGGMNCTLCNQPMLMEMTLVEKAKVVDDSENGYVKGIVTYLIMDDLSITPMSIISALTLLHKFQIKDLSMLREITVEFGMKEALELLEASLQSTTVLTDVYSSKLRVEIDRLNAT